MRKKKVYPEDDVEVVVQAIGLLVQLLSVDPTLLPTFTKCESSFIFEPLPNPWWSFKL